MALYPPLQPVVEAVPPDPQVFRLQKIGELEAFLRSEVESRSRLRKKYHRAVDALDGTSAFFGAACIVTGSIGVGLLASGIGFAAGLALEAVTVATGLFDIAGIAISHHCSAKSEKHESIRILASSKLNTIHSLISKALEDCSISDVEYKLILDEIEKYHEMKNEIRCGKVAAATSSPALDEKTKNELIKKIEKLAASKSPAH